MKIGNINFNPATVKKQKKEDFVKAFDKRIKNPSGAYEILVKEANKTEKKASK